VNGSSSFIHHYRKGILPPFPHFLIGLDCDSFTAVVEGDKIFCALWLELHGTHLDILEYEPWLELIYLTIPSPRDRAVVGSALNQTGQESQHSFFCQAQVSPHLLLICCFCCGSCIPLWSCCDWICCGGSLLHWGSITLLPAALSSSHFEMIVCCRLCPDSHVLHDRGSTIVPNRGKRIGRRISVDGLAEAQCASPSTRIAINLPYNLTGTAAATDSHHVTFREVYQRCQPTRLHLSEANRIGRLSLSGGLSRLDAHHLEQTAINRPHDLTGTATAKDGHCMTCQELYGSANQFMLPACIFS